jgi:SAM-dependent methyltransferase
MRQRFLICPDWSIPPGMTDATDGHLAAQYEAYPYPERNPRDEAKRLIVGSPSHLREIDFWIFGATRPASRPLRVLVAGGGTGDGTIMLATQMQRAGRDGQITYLDRSDAAMRVARARAEARGLTNIDFRQGSLLDLPRLGLGLFDYIDCCGVLHHLPDPSEGLAALVGALAPEGGMGLMVYAPHGRTGVYMLQDALRALAPETEPPAARLEVAKRVMRQLPDTAWLRANGNFADHITGGDAGLYDLLLNPRDQAYDVAGFAALLGRAGLSITCLVEPMRYDPATYFSDPKLRALAAALDPIGRAALAEALCGNISTHIAYVRRTGEPVVTADPMAPEAVPVARETSGPELASGIRPDGVLPFLLSGLRVPVALPKLAAAILNRIDGVRSLAVIAASLADSGVDGASFRRAWGETWARLSHINRILLAPPN